MAIIITDKFQLRQKNFLDDRQGIAPNTGALKSWDYSNVPIPEGFEVYVDGVWYIYKSSHTVDPDLGKFRRRTDDLGIEKIERDLVEFDERVTEDEERIRKTEYDITLYKASSFQEITTPGFWTDEKGINHVGPGRRVTVTSDSDASKNGVWYLINSNYQTASSWIKLLDRKDLIPTGSNTAPTDLNVYTAKNTDAIFPKKGGTEVISGSWKFTDTATFEKDIIVHGNSKITVHEVDADQVNAETGDFKNIQVTENVQVSGNISSGGNIDAGGNLRVTGDLESNGQTSLKDLNVSGDSVFGENNSFGSNGSINDVSGETVATFDKIVAETSEIGDLDRKIEEKLGYIGVSNLLRNTSFIGQNGSEDLEEGTTLNEDTELYSDRFDFWGVTTPDCQVVSNPNYITGYCVLLPNEGAQIFQKTAIPLTKGLDYVLSWKIKGTIKASIDELPPFEEDNIKILPGTEGTEYEIYYTRFTALTDMYMTVRFSGGSGNIGEIKLENGIVPTSWFPCVLDVDPVARLIFKYEYLKTSFQEYTEPGDETVSSIILKNQIKIGDYINGSLEKIYGGISGIINDQTDVMMWSGSSYREAQSLIYQIYRNPKYLDNLSYSELQGLTKLAVTFGSKVIATDLYAVGKFKGQHLDTDGSTIKSYNIISGNIPCNTSDGIQGLKMKGGLLIDNDGLYSSRIIVLSGPGTSSQTLTFINGKCDKTDPSEPITIWTGDKNLVLRFCDGYLIKVSEGSDNSSTYYWY